MSVLFWGGFEPRDGEARAFNNCLEALFEWVRGSGLQGLGLGFRALGV